MKINSNQKTSYSKLLRDITNGEVQSLTLVPARREVFVKYKNGNSVLVPILRNDQFILRTAQSAGTPLTVKDIPSIEIEHLLVKYFRRESFKENSRIHEF